MRCWWKQERILSLVARLVVVVALWLLPNGTQARRQFDSTNPATSPGNQQQQCNGANPFFDATFCGLAKTAISPTNCTKLENFSLVACPSQSDVCNRNFSLTSFCSNSYGCLEDCERYLGLCCDLQCCQDSCLDKAALCTVMELATCANARSEICPCKSDNRTDTEYCTEMVGEAGCIDECLAFMSGCCQVKEGDLRLTNPSINPSDDGDRISGGLEIFMNGEWGLVCEWNFDPKDASVACRQLGFHDKSKYKESFSRTVSKVYLF